MPAIFEYHHTVSDDEIDGQGHVGNLAYLKWMQAAAVAHSAAQGWPSERYIEIGAGWVVRSHKIEYLQPAFVNEKIVLLTWVATFKKVTSLRKYKFVRLENDAVLARAETNWAFIGFQRHVPRRVPSDVSKAFEIVALDQEP